MILGLGEPLWRGGKRLERGIWIQNISGGIALDYCNISYPKPYVFFPLPSHRELTVLATRLWEEKMGFRKNDMDGVSLYGGFLRRVFALNTIYSLKDFRNIQMPVGFSLGAMGTSKGLQ